MRGVYSVLRVPCFDGAVRISRNPLQSGGCRAARCFAMGFALCGTCPATLIFLFRLAVCLPSYAWLMSIVFYKESALFLYRLYWLHQCGIPYRYCRFHCCLAAHQRTRKKDSAEPSFPILWTPPHPPGVIRCGGAYLLPRAWGNIGICIQVLSLLPSSECCAAICVRAGIVRVSVGLLGFGRTFFIIGGRGCLCLRLRGVLLWSIVGFALTANGSFVLFGNGMGYPFSCSFNRTNAFFTIFLHPALLVKLAGIQRNWKKWRGQR